ncbi:MAG: bifunctional metallophosphatase/5'-nucleotidase, partial [Flavobacteriaceae bacterium]|nr:bifunctional metallophosphatase/5'-nucleotidase [Flavobacteriaceae bacterium]
MKRISIFLFILSIALFGCSKDTNNSQGGGTDFKELTIFFVNDQHGQIDNFSKIKHIVDAAKEDGNVLLVCSGDIFSGNPVVDNHPEKGFPMIDVMNKVGFDVSVIGNHEFDYGEAILKDRINQANFDWVCANVETGNSSIPDPFDYKSISIDGLKITFLGLIETNGSDNDIIPSTHPWRIQNLTFE